jgi:LAO/AO transport system kinase
MGEHSETIQSGAALLRAVLAQDRRMLARGISLIENQARGYREILEGLPENTVTRVIGVTGPPGVGKSTLVDAMVSELTKTSKKTAILCVDPSSPFHQGALLGDRIRMNGWHDHPEVFIRSLATRGSTGGLSARIMEITDLVKAGGFDFIIIETVGVGQIEVEISGLADLTIVVLVPDSGDEIQAMKAGLMEISDIFVVNKADRPDSERFCQDLATMMRPEYSGLRPAAGIVKTIATKKQGLPELMELIENRLKAPDLELRRKSALAEKAYQLIVEKRMSDIDKKELARKIELSQLQGPFNLYHFVSAF